MADITGIVKEYAGPLGKFLKKELEIWVQVVSSPRDFIAGIEIGAKSAMLPALYFALFVYMVSIVIAMSRLYALENVDILETRFLIADFVLTFICFCLIGLTLYLIGKSLGGAGGFGASMVAGFYLSAFWPILQVADYFLSPKLSFLTEDQNVIFKFALLIIFAVGFAVFLTLKFYPVIAHLHKFGRFRAVTAAILQIVIVPALISVFLEGYFEDLLTGP